MNELHIKFHNLDLSGLLLLAALNGDLYERSWALLELWPAWGMAACGCTAPWY